jgi:hypothetical protein
MADLTKKYSGGNDDNRRAAIYGLVASLIAVAVIGVVTVVLWQEARLESESAVEKAQVIGIVWP